LRDSDKNKTLRPLKGHKGEKAKALHSYAKATLGTGDMRAAVALPEGEDENEWLAVNTVDIFNQARGGRLGGGWRVGPESASLCPR
jgi:hypothetical protein